MIYEYVSENIIACENFLPPHILQNIEIDLLNNRTNFVTPYWRTEDKKKEFNEFGKHCGALDYWIQEGDTVQNNDNIRSLNRWFYHQGFFSFLNSSGRSNVFNFLTKPKTHMIHVVSYNDGGYYSWHRDSEFFTFNLILNKGDQLTGGEMLFMDEGRIIELPNLHNYMVVFPNYVSHAIRPIISKDGKDVAFPQQRFSIQYWVKLCS